MSYKRKTENGTDAAEREQRLLADFAEPQGRKACVAGLKLKTENGKLKAKSEKLILNSQFLILNS